MTTGHEPGYEVALNADVVGYSRLMADDKEMTAEAMDHLHELVDEQVAAGRGTVANFVGDSFMAVFDDPRRAVRTAIAVTTALEEGNANTPEPRRLRLRMGIDLGDVAVSEGRFFGDALNIAARIQAIAPPGGLSVSGRVYRALDEPALRFTPLGRQKLKNIPEKVDVYEFVDLPSDRVAGGGRRSLSLEAPTLAVLPTITEMVDDSVRALASAIRGDLIHRLSRIPQLRVVDAKTEPEGHPDLTARYMLETGINQFGESARVYATLFDVTTMNVVKAHKWTTRVDEILDLSDRVAEEVASSVTVELIVGEPAGLYAELEDPEAIEKVYLGWYHLRTGTREGWAHALNLFGQVAEAHPEQPYGFVLAAFAKWIGASSDWTQDPEQTYREARELADKGQEIGDPTGMAKAVQGAVLMSQGKVEEALVAIEQLDITRPTCDVTFGLEGSIRRYMGEWEKAIDLLDVAMRLTGVNKPWYPTVKACSLFMGGRFEQAASVAEMVLEYQPRNLEALLVLAAAEVELGLDRRARATTQLIKENFPAVDVEAWLDKNPYQKQELVDRWKKDLATAGAIDVV